MAYKIARPFKSAKLASYFNGDEYKVYATEESVLIGDDAFLFRIPQHFMEYYNKDLGPYLPPKLDQQYRGQKGKLEECHRRSLPGFWSRYTHMADAYIVRPTNHLYQHAERLIIRKFTDGEHIVWLNKMVVEIMGAMACDLEPDYQFEMLYMPSNPMWKQPVRVSFRQNDTWEPVALLSPFNMSEENQICALCKEKLPC